MFCPNCGNEMKDGELFCANCGTKCEENVPTTYVPSEDGVKGKVSYMMNALGKYKILFLVGIGLWFLSLVLSVTPIFELSIELFGMKDAETMSAFQDEFFGTLGTVIGILYIIVQVAIVALLAMQFLFFKNFSLPLVTWTTIASMAVTLLDVIILFIKGIIEKGNMLEGAPSGYEDLLSFGFSGVGIVFLLFYVAAAALIIVSLVLLSKAIAGMKNPMGELSALK